MNEPVIRVDNLWKRYFLGGEVDRNGTFREMLTGVLTEPLSRLRKLQGKSNGQESFWALEDVSLEVNEGEVLGIVGVNGAGKSTLLKILSRITAPTRGSVHYKGQVASLLEVGTGFHPELSGRENIFVNGAILGMTKAEIRKRFDEIVEFAGIERFLETPVKRYSSGMYVRLAFAVAAHLEADILLIDEVLAVGDVEFQGRCMAKLRDVGNQGRTVVFVSHNMNAVRSLCSKAVCLERGKIGLIGDVRDVLAHYFSSVSSGSMDWKAHPNVSDPERILESVHLENSRKEATNVIAHNECCNAVVRFIAPDRKREFSVAVRITDALSNVLFTSWDSDWLKYKNTICGREYEESCKVPSNLLVPGRYLISVFVRETSYGVVQISEEVSLNFTVSENGYHIDEGRLGIVAPPVEWSIRPVR